MGSPETNRNTLTKKKNDKKPLQKTIKSNIILTNVLISCFTSDHSCVTHNVTRKHSVVSRLRKMSHRGKEYI